MTSLYFVSNESQSKTKLVQLTIFFWPSITRTFSKPILVLTYWVIPDNVVTFVPATSNGSQNEALHPLAFSKRTHFLSFRCILFLENCPLRSHRADVWFWQYHLHGRHSDPECLSLGRNDRPFLLLYQSHHHTHLLRRH